MTFIIPPTADKWLAAQRPVSAGRLEGDRREMIADEVGRAVSMLPKGIKSVLDIGCGVGLTTLHLWKHLGCEVAGLDGTGLDEVRSGYRQSKGPWNDTSVTKELWSANGLDARIYSIGEPVDRKFDLLTSFAAWGWHFPLWTYNAESLLNSPGYAAFDARVGVTHVPNHWQCLATRVANRKRVFSVFQVR